MFKRGLKDLLLTLTGVTFGTVSRLRISEFENHATCNSRSGIERGNKK
jgi:hypothetical protein